MFLCFSIKIKILPYSISIAQRVFTVQDACKPLSRPWQLVIKDSSPCTHYKIQSHTDLRKEHRYSPQMLPLQDGGPCVGTGAQETYMPLSAMPSLLFHWFIPRCQNSTTRPQSPAYGPQTAGKTTAFAGSWNTLVASMLSRSDAPFRQMVTCVCWSVTS